MNMRTRRATTISVVFANCLSLAIAGQANAQQAGEGASPLSLAMRISDFRPANGSSPVSASKSMTPTAYQSPAGVGCAPSHCSGAM